VAISKLSQERIARYWGREAPIVYPPVELGRFSPAESEDFFLFVGELVRHKNVELALQAAHRAKKPIKIVGSGPDEGRLRSEYGDSAEFLGRMDDVELAGLYARTRALIMPNVEEFGITAVEAQASGRPVIAVDGGGARETVLDQETGIFFPENDLDALTQAMENPFLDQFDPALAVANAQTFSVDAFKTGMLEQIRIATEAA
jgi:glycosyltransferase involved in cell wall biosynthesis